MVTPQNCLTPKRLCACSPKVGGPDMGVEKGYVAAIMHTTRTLSVGSPESPPTASLGASHSLESLVHALSSRSGRESLYALPIDQAVEAINNLELKRFSMVLRKMCLGHRRLPHSYGINDELKWIGPYPYGGGGNADVWRGIYQGSKVAIKALRINSRVNFVDLERKFCREVVIWKQLKHSNLLPLVGAKKSPQTLVMISEWMEHGTIMDFVAAYPETSRLKLLADVARGLEYLHNWPSVHGDLKSNNILIDSSHRARIADFGLTSLLRHPSISISVSVPAWGGTLLWMAPELLEGGSRPSRESDIYSFGMVVYEVFAHSRPPPYVLQLATPGVLPSGRRPSRPTHGAVLGLSEDIWGVTERCWDWVPSARPHAEDILALLEAASRGWIPPTSEVIGGLDRGRSAGRNPSLTESTDTMSETVFVTTGSCSPGSREGQSPLTSN